MDQELSPLYVTIQDMCYLLHKAVPPSLHNAFSRYHHCEQLVKGLVIFVANSDPSDVECLFNNDQLSGVYYNVDPNHWPRNWQWVFTHGHYCLHPEPLPVDKALDQVAFGKSKAVKIARALKHNHELGTVVAYWISKLYMATGIQFKDLPEILQIRYWRFVLKHDGWQLLHPVLPFADERMTFHRMTRERFPLAVPLQSFHLDRRIFTANFVPIHQQNIECSVETANGEEGQHWQQYRAIEEPTTEPLDLSMPKKAAGPHFGLRI